MQYSAGKLFTCSPNLAGHVREGSGTRNNRGGEEKEVIMGNDRGV